MLTLFANDNLVIFCGVNLGQIKKGCKKSSNAGYGGGLFSFITLLIPGYVRRSGGLNITKTLLL